MNKNKRERKISLKALKVIQRQLYLRLFLFMVHLCGACSDCSISKIYEFYSL